MEFDFPLRTGTGLGRSVLGWQWQLRLGLGAERWSLTDWRQVAWTGRDRKSDLAMLAFILIDRTLTLWGLVTAYVAKLHWLRFFWAAWMLRAVLDS